jgi:hypothetical protein
VLADIISAEYLQLDSEPWTRLALATRLRIAGKPGDTFTVLIPGGLQYLNGRPYVTQVEGTPSVVLRQRGIFFLHAVPPQEYRLTGATNSYFRVIEINGREFVEIPGSSPVDPEIFKRSVLKARSGIEQ